MIVVASVASGKSFLNEVQVIDLYGYSSPYCSLINLLTFLFITF